VSAADRQPTFEDLVNRPYAWQHTAYEFILAANYLIDWYNPSTEDGPDDLEFTIGGPAPMMVLFALAVENLLKAIRVAKGPTPVTEKGELSGSFAHHRLISHASLAGLVLSDDEQKLLAQLTDVVQAGKYPVPTRPGGNEQAWRFDYPRDVERVWRLLERLDTDLRTSGTRCVPPRSLRVRYRPPGYELARELDRIGE
jgi:hypothetical protein